MSGPLSTTSGRVLILLLCVSATLRAQSAGPDVIVGALHAVSSFGSQNGVSAFAVGTTSCNIGNSSVAWYANTVDHPVVAQNLYRLRNGRLQQIGMSWIKHGFSAVSGVLCSPCTGDPSGLTLGPGCSDPYSSALNGTQSGLAPRSEINAANGTFPFPPASPAFSGAIARRLQAKNLDIDPTLNSGALFLAEGHYVAADDAAAGNDDNNASVRAVVFNPSGANFTMAFAPASTTIRLPAVAAWKLIDPTVVVQNIDIPGDGRLVLGFKQIDLGGGVSRYEYAVFNMSSDRSVKSFSIALPQNANITNVGFSDVDYHSGEPYSGADWTNSFVNGQLTWTTEDHSTNPNANALRWSTMYSFWFDADVFPSESTFGLFKPGVPADVVHPSPLPPFTLAIAGGAPTRIAPGITAPITVSATNLHGSPSSAGAMIFHRTETQVGFSATPLNFVGGNTFSGQLPALPPFTRFEWYVSVNANGGLAPVTLPVPAPQGLFTTECDLIPTETVFADTFETTQGWTTSSISAFAGFWERVIPNPTGGPGTTSADFDGSGRCYVTGNGSNSDVDFGSVLLTSPTISLAGQTDARVNVAIWYDNDSGAFANEDVFQVQVSSDNGASWITMDNWTGNTNSWVERHYRIGAWTTLGAQMRFRFIASDLIHDSTIEAAIDAFRIEVPSVGIVSASGAGNVSENAGGPFDVLRVNTSTGGFNRRVDIAYGVPIAISMDNPPTTLFPAGFTVFGLLRAVFPGEEQNLPAGLGTMCFAPCPYNPLDFSRFTLMDNIAASPGCPPIVGSFQAPFTYTFQPGLFFDVTFTLQGLVIDSSDPLSLSITNGVVVRVRAP